VAEIHPSSIDHKQTQQRSGNVVARYRKPTSEMAAFNTQFVHNYSEQKAFIPSGGVICRATQRTTNSGDTTINSNGKTAALGSLSHAFIGGTRRGSGPF